MTGAKAVQRPSWLMVVLGVLGLLACLGPAAFTIAFDWGETLLQAQSRSDDVASSVATQLAETLEQGRYVLPRLAAVLENGGTLSAASVDQVLPHKGGWVAVFDASGKPLLVSPGAGGAHRPAQPLYFVRQADGTLMALMSQASVDRNQVMVVALPVPGLLTSHIHVLTVETPSGDILFSEGGLRSQDLAAYGIGMQMSRKSVAGQPLFVKASAESRDLIDLWGRRTKRTAGAALVAAFLVIPILLVIASRLARDTRDSAALQAANRELSRSNADLEQFAYVASHDLKEPLRNIASYVQLLQRRYQGKLDEDADAFIGYTVEGVRRMQVIINELLAYSRIGTGPLVTAPVQTGALVSAVLGNLKAAIAEAGAVVDVAGPLPVVMGDSGQLTSVFQNLLANALKYRRDDVRPEVKVTVSDMGGIWRFSIADNGIGIDPAYQQQIFELFKRLHSRDRYTGSGIGLAVCQRVVERHGGAIWVDSIPGQGACFHFTLPKMGA